MQEIKKSYRKELISRRKAMDPEEKRLADEDIFARLKSIIDNADSVLTYVSTDIEVDTRRVLEYCFSIGRKVAVPVSGDTELSFYEIHSFDDLAEGRFGILEPISRDKEFIGDERSVCLVPALCADLKGSRLGYGRGYYDRYLSGFRGRSVILCYHDFIMELPSEPHDIKADETIYDTLPKKTKRRSHGK